MDEKKQIEEIDELTTVLYEANHKKSVLDYRWLATEAYNAGYCKQSEGEWVDEPHFAQRGLKGKYYVCSKCNVCVPTIEELPLYMWHYCPNCGAKMKGGESDA